MIPLNSTIDSRGRIAMWNHEDFSSITIISDGSGNFISILGGWNISIRQWGSLSGVRPAYTPLSCTAKLLVQFSPLMIASLGADERINTFPAFSGMKPIKHHPDVNISEEQYFATLIDIATAV